MTIIRDLDENENVIEPTNDVESINMLRHYVGNLRQPDETFDYKLVKLGIFGSYSSSFDSFFGTNSISVSSIQRKFQKHIIPNYISSFTLF